MPSVGGAMTVTAAGIDNTLKMDQFRHLRDIIYEKSGIFFTENKHYLLETRLGHRLRDLELGSFDEYIRFIQSRPGSDPEFHKIYNAVTINETFFFRYQAQLEAFRLKMLPPLVDQRAKAGDRRLNIWSAASSSGEELYTLSIMLHERLGADLANWKLNLLGTDISNRALGRAKAAVFTKNSFRGAMSPSQKSRFFEQNSDLFTLRDEIKKMAIFRYLNLNESMEIRKLRGMDFVFCRNVLIYFDEAMKKRVLNAIYDILNHDGYLFLGEAESLHGISSAFKVEHFPGAFAYKKE